MLLYKKQKIKFLEVFFMKRLLSLLVVLTELSSIEFTQMMGGDIINTIRGLVISRMFI